MRCHAALLSILAVAVVLPLRADSPPTFSTDIDVIINLGTLTPANAARLDGHRGVFLVTIDPDADAEGDVPGAAVLRCCLPNDEKVCREVILPPGNHPGNELVVEGVLHVVHHPGFIGLDGRWVPPLIQPRVMADRVR